MNIYFNGTNLELLVNDESYRYRAIKGEHSLTLYYSLPEHIEIPLGAYCIYEGEEYTLEKPENFTMHNTRNFEYTLILDAQQAKLSKYKFKDVTSRKLKFSLTAKPEEHLKMLVENLNQRESGWSVGDCIEANEKVISYNHAYCIDALSQMADEFDTEWEIDRKRISLRKVEYNKDFPLPLSYGRGKGFKSGVGRANEGSKPIEILYVQGGDRNINPSVYKSPELLLPKGQVLEYEDRKYISDADGFYIRRLDKDLVTGVEDSLDCSHIYPSRVGEVTAVEVVNAEKHFYDFIDSSIPDDLNFKDCLIPGETITVIFQSGILAGKEFEVKYTHTGKVDGEDVAIRRFEIVPQELDGRTMPDDTFKPKKGDTYAVFGISLPDTYVCNNTEQVGASWEMYKEAAKFLYENEGQKFTFTGELDGIWAKRDWPNIGGRIKLGGYIFFRDEQFEPEGVSIRIVGVKDYINNPHSPVIELSNSVVGSTISSDLKKIGSNEIVVDNKHKDALQFTKRRFRDSIETIAMLEDALLDNFTNSISPIAIQTMSLLVGDESLQFRFVESKTDLTEVAHNVIWDKETKILTSPKGILQHMTLGIDSISSSHKPNEYKIWTVYEFNSPPLTDGSKKYYLYAKVFNTDEMVSFGSFYLSEKAIAMEEEKGFYHLLMGILNSEYEGERSFVTLYGFTEILPGRITTDRVVSSDGQNFLDFVANAFRVGNSSTFLDFNTKGDGKLRLKGTLIQNEGGDEDIVGLFRGVYSDLYVYYRGDEVVYEYEGSTSTYRYIHEYPSKGNPPTNTTYWMVVARGRPGEDGEGTPGKDGDFYEYRYAVNGSRIAPPNLDVTAFEPEGWITEMPSVNDLQYLWCTVTKKSSTELLQNWSKPVRMTPHDGKDGENGGPGPSMVYRDAYSDDKIYYGTSKRVDAVKFLGNYYVARSDAGDGFEGQPPVVNGVINSDYWNDFGAQFESIATNLLLAENANIAGWIFTRYGAVMQKIYSQNTTNDGTSKATLDGVNAKLELASDTTKYNPTGGFYNVKQTINLSSGSGLLESNTTEGDKAYFSSQGIYANSAGVKHETNDFNEDGSFKDIYSSIVALGNRNLRKGDVYNERVVCGVYGDAINNYSDPSYVFGGYFRKLLALGLYFGCRRIDKNTWLTGTHCYISAMNTSDINVYLPSKPQIGQIIMIRRVNSSNVTIQGNGIGIHVDSSTTVTSKTTARGDTAVLIYDGQNWNFNYWVR
ncbi:hypothetical protein [Bacteroides sp. 51]|uniref:hypothetical protein n=1 Tax=Bacteroides sp. 51 TaxID=2302938 RepID=UPI0013D279C9|nr:hypothetical protein [Bacteroides sp. 51]NDV81321.1 hypothetical protein [Bacteroides sp. 51]